MAWGDSSKWNTPDWQTIKGVLCAYAKKVLTNVVNAGAATEKFDARPFRRAVIRIDNASDQNADFTVRGYTKDTSTDAVTLKGPTTVNAGAKGKFELEWADEFWPYIDVLADPAADSAGDITIEIVAQS